MAHFDPHAIVVAVWTLWALSAVFIGLRLYCKSFRRAKYGWDDWVLVVAWAATLANCIVVTVDIKIHPITAGPPDPSMLKSTALTGLLSVTFAIIGQSLSKVSFGLTLLAISEGWIRWFIRVAILLINILFGLGALLLWVGCSPVQKTWDPVVPGTCWNPRFHVNLAIFVSAFSGTMDLCFAVIPWRIILSLQMNRREKLGVAFALSMGAVAAITAFIKCASLNSLDIGQRPGTMLVIFGVAEPALTIVAASVPFLRVLVKHVVSSQEYHLSNFHSARSNRSKQIDLSNRSRGVKTSVITSRADHSDHLEGADARSDTSILDMPAPSAGANNGIMRTQGFKVSYESRGSGPD